MANKLTKKPPTRRDAADGARAKLAGRLSHINEAEDRLLRDMLPDSHGEVVTRGLLAEAGRRGDDRVTKLTAEERRLLKARGGSGTRNPASGLLEYSTAGGGGGEGGDNGVGGPDNGSDGFGSDGTISGGIGRDSFSGGPGSDTFGGGVGEGSGLGYRNYDPMSMPAIESLLAAPSFAPPGMSMTQYAPRDTWSRVRQEYINPSVRGPGRLGAPNAHGPGIMGGFVSHLAGGPFSAAMGWGGALGRASSKETQEKAAAEFAEQGRHNSAGQQQSHSVLDMDAAQAERAGTRSGAATADLPTAPPGYTINPAGQVVPMGGDNRAAWKDPVQNLLADYIWRGRSGTGGPFSW